MNRRSFIKFAAAFSGALGLAKTGAARSVSSSGESAASVAPRSKAMTRNYVGSGRNIRTVWSLTNDTAPDAKMYPGRNGDSLMAMRPNGEMDIYEMNGNEWHYRFSKPTGAHADYDRAARHPSSLDAHVGKFEPVGKHQDFPDIIPATKPVTDGGAHWYDQAPMKW